MSRLVLVTCGAGINTSAIAEDTIRERLEEEDLDDVTVKRILDADLGGYLDHPDLTLVISMMKLYRDDIPVPVVKGMPFLIGTRAEKDELLDKIIGLIEE